MTDQYTVDVFPTDFDPSILLSLELDARLVNATDEIVKATGLPSIYVQNRLEETGIDQRGKDYPILISHPYFPPINATFEIVGAYDNGCIWGALESNHEVTLDVRRRYDKMGVVEDMAVLAMSGEPFDNLAMLRRKEDTVEVLIISIQGDFSERPGGVDACLAALARAD